MEWTLENMTFVVIMISAACGGLMVLTNIVLEILKVTPWGRRHFEKMSVHMAEKVIEENYIQYTCPSCNTTMSYSHHVENYCPRCGHAVLEEEKKKYER